MLAEQEIEKHYVIEMMDISQYNKIYTILTV